jgi:hypothetical protein
MLGECGKRHLVLTSALAQHIRGQRDRSFH